MGLRLYVDGERWRGHLRASLAARPDLVPVIKGNGYGLGRGRLARRAEWLGVDTVAVGTHSEIAEVASRCSADLLVLTPWREWTPAELADRSSGSLAADVARRVIHTVDRVEDLRALDAGAAATPGARPVRVVLERTTSMLRHGLSARELREAASIAATLRHVVVEGVAMHLPLGARGHLSEVGRLMQDVVAAGLPESCVWVSHLTDAELATLAGQWPEFRFRPRVGTDLWLGDRGALEVRATVLDSHRVQRGDTYGYRGRSAPRHGTILVVSGGTAHGIGLEAPVGDLGLRSRAATLARGGLDAAGFVRSPFLIDGKHPLFAEPPHMQASMLFLPESTRVPAIGEEIGVRCRFTATDVDDVVVG